MSQAKGPKVLKKKKKNVATVRDWDRDNGERDNKAEEREWEKIRGIKLYCPIW